MTKPQHPRAGWNAEALRSIPDLIDEAQQAAGGLHGAPSALQHALASIPALDVSGALVRMDTVEGSPIKAWALHRRLDALNVPPCLRPGRYRWETEQHRFIATLADLWWLNRHHRGHMVRDGRWRAVFDLDPAQRIHDNPLAPTWHSAALWAYRHSRGAGHALAEALALTDGMRQQTLTMQTKRQAAQRREHTQRSARIREALTRHAEAHPDKSGTLTPDHIASERADLIRIHIMLGRSPTATARYYSDVLGHPISRQALSRKLDAAGDAIRWAMTTGADIKTLRL